MLVDLLSSMNLTFASHISFVSQCVLIRSSGTIIEPTLIPLRPIQYLIPTYFHGYTSASSTTSHDIGSIVDFGVQNSGSQYELSIGSSDRDVYVIDHQVDVLPIVLRSDNGEASIVAPAIDASSSIQPSSVTMDIPIKDLPTSIQDINSHPMITRSKTRVFKPKSF